MIGSFRGHISLIMIDTSMKVETEKKENIKKVSKLGLRDNQNNKQVSRL